MLTLTRTANAGVLLCMDGKKILLDGVCGHVAPYKATPDAVKTALSKAYPDLVAVTHRHEDHCDPLFEEGYRKATARSVIDPSFTGQKIQEGTITLHVIPSRHIGKADCDHVSFVLEGSQCVWFMGDASPNQWKNRTELPRPDLLICPYAYASTEASWRMTQSLGAKKTVLLHLPDRGEDPFGLWDAVEQTAGGNSAVFIPKMEEFIEISF